MLSKDIVRNKRLRIGSSRNLWCIYTRQKNQASYIMDCLVTELFAVAVNDFDANKSARCNRFVLIELVKSATQCT